MNEQSQIKQQNIKKLNSIKSHKLMNVFYNNFMEALKKDDFGIIQQIVKNIEEEGININTKTGRNNQPLLFYVLSNFIDNPSDFVLKTIEYLIQNGANINDAYNGPAFLSPTPPLEHVIIKMECAIFRGIPAQNIQEFYYKLIALLLAYGSKVTQKAINLALAKQHTYPEISKIFDQNATAINLAKTNPTEYLLIEAINLNMPCIVKLIIQRNPGLVTLENIESANITSPSSVYLLRRALDIQKFRETELTQEQLSLEVIEHIEKFVLNK